MAKPPARTKVAKAARPAPAAHTISTAIPVSNAMSADADAALFTNAGALEPPFAPSELTALYERSSSLRPCVDAYATNIHGFGHRLEPAIDLDADDASQRIAAIIQQRKAKAAGVSSLGDAAMPSDADVEEEKKRMVLAMRVERSRATQFFSFCCEDMSFIALRRALCEDQEKLGNAYMEVLRNRAGELAGFVYLPGYTMRLMPLDRERTSCVSRRKFSDVDYEDVPTEKHFRRFVQAIMGRCVYFREFGDPRIMSAYTGKFYATAEDMRRNEPTAPLATEVVHFRVRTSRSAYGIPRWIGTLVNVVGQRQAEEVNQSYFGSKAVPPLAIVVSGGALAPDAVERIRDFMKNHIQGVDNFHRVLVIEAETGSGTALDQAGNVKVDIKPLTEAQLKDGLFLNYDERASDKSGVAFRLSRILRGDVRDFNRATAEAALEFTEQQVFGPERADFDFFINRQVLPAMGVRFWTFASNAPQVRDPERLASIIAKLSLAGVLTPGEARELAQQVFGRELRNLDATWTDQPLQLTLAGIVAQSGQHLDPYTGEPLDVDERPAGYDDLDGDGTSDTAQPPPGAQITRTALGSVITVNEARAAHGLGPKVLGNGDPDPSGQLTVAEFVARSQAAAERAGKPDLSAMFGGLSVKRARVAALGALRSALVQAEREETAKALVRKAAAAFKEAKGADALSSEFLREVFPAGEVS